MATATEGKYAGCFVNDDEGEGSRDACVVLSGQVLQAGHVIGRLDGTAGSASIPTVVGTGNGTASLVSTGPDALIGNYVVKLKTVVVNGGVFSVTAPSGLALPDLTLTVGAGAVTPYTSSHINFSITDGSTDFALNDTFTFVVGATAPTVLGGTGNGIISLVSKGPLGMPGTYRIICRQAVTNGGRFEVIAPDGESLGDEFNMTAGAGAATAFTTPHLNFTLTDGSTDFIVGNEFRVAVFEPLVMKVVEWDPTASDGRQTVAGISWDNYDATAGDIPGVIENRTAIVVGAELTFKATVTAAQQASAKAALTAMGVVVR